MFDDPKKELQALEDRLLAAEAHTEEPDDAFAQICAGVLAELDQDDADNAPIRNFANNYGRKAPSQTAAVPPVSEPKSVPAPAPAPRKEKIGALVLLTILEILVAAGLIAYWLGGRK